MNSAVQRKSGHTAQWHPIPNALIDEIMPGLRDTELRICLVVLRQTWGWRADRLSGDGGHKRRDWISHRQLCQRTGRGSDAVSASVASLTASGLIAVEDASGRPMATAEERRRHLGRLYFRLGDVWADVEKWKTAGQARPEKSGTTTEGL